MKRDVKYIYFDGLHKQIAIAKEGYEQIKQTIERYRACGNCGQLFTGENPQVSLNWCKDCFIQHGEGKRHGLTYLGIVSPEPAQYRGIEYKFIAPDGTIYVTGAEADLTHGMTYNQDNRKTLTYWNFPALPEKYTIQGEETRLHDNYIHIYGDVRKDNVVFIGYDETHGYSASVHLIFFAYRNGELQEFNKRKGEGRKLWRAAKARLEATKDARGDYHIGEYVRSWTSDSDLYEFAVAILNEQAEIQTLEQRKALASQPIDENVKPGDHIQLSLTAFEEDRLQQLKEKQS